MITEEPPVKVISTDNTRQFMPRCDNCFFWQRFNAEFEGRCRAMPPTVTSGGGTRWPQVGQDQWCGMHKPLPAGQVVPPKEKVHPPQRGERLKR